ncbi:MAG: TlpA family protein disulfide reductase [Leptospiraceae bacterium]|nr:TlpA family protein disulfide reductase [Leptospiraceae bacterium]
MKKLFPLFFFVVFCSPRNEGKELSIPLRDWNGKKVTLSDFKGKIVVLDFWASWCEPCKKSVPVIEALKKNSDPEKVVFFGVNTDSEKTPAEVQRFAKKFGMTYDSLLDSSMVLSESLQITGLPALAFFNGNGELLYRQYGVSVTDLPFLSHKLKNWSNGKN